MIEAYGNRYVNLHQQGSMLTATELIRRARGNAGYAPIRSSAGSALTTANAVGSVFGNPNPGLTEPWKESFVRISGGVITDTTTPVVAPTLNPSPTLPPRVVSQMPPPRSHTDSPVQPMNELLSTTQSENARLKAELAEAKALSQRMGSISSSSSSSSSSSMARI